MIRILKTVSDWRNTISLTEYSNKSLGFVPTMGALHKGHLSLIERSINENDVSVVSIFVNPTQFNDPDDLRNYPQTFEKDLEMIQKAGVDFLFYPDYNELYPDQYTYKIIENNLSKILCGKLRPGHFDGVLTVVMKLLNIIDPDKAYFGEKDYQQYKLIDGMCRAFFVKTQIVPCPIIRDEDGLALSSRNKLLTAEQRNVAADFPRLLKSDLKLNEIKSELENAGFKVDYIEEINDRRFGAVFIGNVRLIDNVRI